MPLDGHGLAAAPCARHLHSLARSGHRPAPAARGRSPSRPAGPGKIPHWRTRSALALRTPDASNKQVRYRSSWRTSGLRPSPYRYRTRPAANITIILMSCK